MSSSWLAAQAEEAAQAAEAAANAPAESAGGGAAAGGGAGVKSTASSSPRPGSTNRLRLGPESRADSLSGSGSIRFQREGGVALLHAGHVETGGQQRRPLDSACLVPRSFAVQIVAACLNTDGRL